MRAMVAIGLVWACMGAQAADREWAGIVKQEPADNGGNWAIGSRQVAIGPDVERRDKVGPLVIGACAQLHLADAELLERIETRPMSVCDATDYQAYFARYAPRDGRREKDAPSPAP